MTLPFKIGVLQLSMEPLTGTVCMAQACEAAEFDIFWLAEAYRVGDQQHLRPRKGTP